MAKLIVPQDPEVPGAAQSEIVDRELHRQRVRDSIQSFASSAIVVALLMAILALIAILPWGREIPTIVTYQAPTPEEEKIEHKEMTNQARPRPAGAKSSRAKVIASTAPAPTSVPVPDNPIPEGPFGMSDSFGEGFGDSDGDGDGGGGVSFFGSYRRGKRVAFLVDYSGSMGSDVEGGAGTRLGALKEELAKSIEGLNSSMSFTVIFFSHHGWTIETEGPDHSGNGWNGLGDTPHVNWYPASSAIKKRVAQQVRSMPAGGNTNWYMPLKMAFSMTPAPSIVYLLSDGEPRDGDDVLFRIKEINPHHTPVDTIAFELPGSPAGMLMEISRVTGGRFTMVYKGKRLSGMAAEKLTSPTYD
jgi:hypothetical protein